MDQQPIKQKDLQSKTFDDFIPALSIPRNLASFIAWNSHKHDFLVKTLYEAIERYAAYREQQAKHAGFIEGCDAQKIKCAEAADACITNGYPEVNKDSFLKCENADSPYQGWEKGGKNE